MNHPARKRTALWGTLVALASLLSGGCRPLSAGERAPVAPPPTANAPSVTFTDITDRAGIRFVHNNGAFGKKWMPETTGSGCAFIDYDRDGWEDIVLINSGPFDTPRATYTSRDPRSRVTLYRNNGDGTFADVTEAAGLRVTGYGQGVCVGDFDNDGWDDLYITCLGPNHLFRNTGQGRFTDVTARAKVAGVPVNGSLRWKWSSSAAWFDYDRDGLLDLFVCNFVDWSPETDVYCGQKGGSKDYCAPIAYRGLANTLYRNLGNGVFEDVSAQTRIGEYIGKAWGVAIWDYNNDGWLDIAIANDTEPNYLFVNEQGQSFAEQALQAGIALSETGHAKAGMGIDVADWNNDGRDTLLIGNFSNEKLSLFTPDAGGLMRDLADKTGLGEASLRFLTFGLFFFDFDLDGWQDAFIANGHIQEFVEELNTNITYKERPLLLHNQRNGTFVDVAEKSGAPLQGRYVLRGCAAGDIDNDGDLDILVVENNNRARLWRNERQNENHWVRVRLEGKTSNRNGIGALITLKAGGVTQRQWIRSGCSFMSQSSLIATFGLGNATQIEELTVRWPSGRTQRIAPPAADRLVTIAEGPPQNASRQ
jgi:hypothetical protein